MAFVHPNDKEYIDKLTEIVEENFSNNCFGVEELAKEMGMSKSSLYRKLKAIAKQSISQFIRETRLKRAMELLQLQACTVHEVAFGVGFGSTTYFSKCFHDFYGYPPGEVRKRFKSRPASKLYQDQSSEGGKKVESIAVLPFDSYGNDESLEFLSFGMHDALIGELGQLGTIRVISKTSVLSYANTDKTIKEIARELDVDSVLEGSVMSIHEQIRIQLKLYQVFPDEKQVWSQSYELDMSHILNLYNQVICQIAGEIHMKLTPEQRIKLAGSREVHPESYKAYLRGRYHLYQLTPEGMRLGLEYLHEAVRLDPVEPFAYAGMALGYLEIAHGPLNPGDAYVKAEAAALQALRLDPNLAEAQLAIAELCIYSTWKFAEGEKYFKRALELNPNLSLAHYHYSWLLFLLGRHEEAIIEHELAQKYDPFNPMITAFTGILYGFLGRFEDGIREANKAFELQKDCPDSYFVLGEIYLGMGRMEEALVSSKKLAEVDPTWNWVLGFMYARTHHSREAEKVLLELEGAPMTSWNAMGVGLIHGALGNKQASFEWLNYKPHHAWIPWTAFMPNWMPLYGDPLHEEFVRQLNLPKQ